MAGYFSSRMSLRLLIGRQQGFPNQAEAYFAPADPPQPTWHHVQWPVEGEDTKDLEAELLVSVAV